jgi:hypothetical protein
MKKLVLFLLASTCALISYSQKANYIQFKLYKNVAFELGQTQGTRTIELGTFSPAIAWGKNENFHEIQLLSVNFFSRSRARNYSAGAEYSYNYCFSDDKQSKVQVYLGGGVGGSFASNYSEIFRGSTAVSSKGVFINTHLIALPRITYRLKSNILLDLSLPYKIMTYENSQLVEEDPSIPVNQQTTTINVTNFFPSALSLKIGATVRF